MSWTTAIADVRTVLSDGATDRLRWRKKCLGIANGTNKVFKTFEKRRLSPFVAPTAPVAVYVNDSPSTVDSESLAVGEFTLHTAPAEGARVEATYYVQWFLDAQIDAYLRMASFFLGLGATYSNIPEGLQPAAVKYASADAYQELSVRFSEMVSEQYRMEDLPKDALKDTIKGFQDLAKQYRAEAESLRKGFYTRQNESDSPIFDSIGGGVHTVEPNA